MLVACGAAAAALVLARRPRPDGDRSLAAADRAGARARQRLGRAAGRRLPRQPGQVGAAALVGALALAALVAAFRRRPWLFAIAAFAVLPLRVPIEIGGETANLLVPLYLVIAAGFITFGAPSNEHRADEQRDAWPVWLRRLLAATLVLYAIQATYSEDVANAIENIGFFLVPVRGPVRAARRGPLDPRAARRVLVAVAARRRGVRGGRHLPVLRRRPVPQPRALRRQPAARLLPGQLDLLRPEHLRPLPGAGDHRARRLHRLGRLAARSDRGARGIRDRSARRSRSATRSPASRPCSPGSGSSRSCAGAGAGAVAFGALGVAGLVALAVAGGTPTSDIEDYRSIDSGHADLIEGGLELAADRPFAGWGSGSFGRAFYEQIEPARTTVSHSEPITVAAEQGADRAARLRRPAGHRAGHVCSAARRAARWPARAVAACFVAMLVPSLGYAGFVIDPATWALLGLGVALRRSARPRYRGDVRVPAPPRDHGRRVHGLERALEADRGLPAAGLHRLPDAGRLRRRRGDAGLGDRGQHRRPPRPDRGAAALLLPRRRAPRSGSSRPASRRSSGRRPRRPRSGSRSPSRSPRRCSTAPTPSSPGSRCSACGR